MCTRCHFFFCVRDAGVWCELVLSSLLLFLIPCPPTRWHDESEAAEEERTIALSQQDEGEHKASLPPFLCPEHAALCVCVRAHFANRDVWRPKQPE